MPRLKVLSGKSVIKMLRHFGFVVVGQHGSHVQMKLGAHKATIPLHDELKKKTMLDIYRQLESMISKDDLDDMFYTK
ncbi:MAG: type II toxin-antitoxin system HicA family toxin [Patescibacteria group bacterium]|nr:type II toxin-antitoxin system HicA family toxin [Patescibacteria group bacterium]